MVGTNHQETQTFRSREYVNLELPVRKSQDTRTKTTTQLTLV